MAAAFWDFLTAFFVQIFYLFVSYVWLNTSYTGPGSRWRVTNSKLIDFRWLTGIAVGRKKLNQAH